MINIKTKELFTGPLLMDTVYKLIVFSGKKEPDCIICYKTYFQ